MRVSWDWRHTNYIASVSPGANARQPSKTINPSRIGGSSIFIQLHKQLADLSARGEWAEVLDRYRGLASSHRRSL